MPAQYYENRPAQINVASIIVDDFRYICETARGFFILCPSTTRELRPKARTSIFSLRLIEGWHSLNQRNVLILWQSSNYVAFSTC